MQKITPIALIVVLVMLLVNLVWTTAIRHNISEISEFVAEKTEFVRMAQDLADSKVVDRFSFVAGGYISAVEDRNLTIVNGDSVMTVPVALDAQIVKQAGREELPETITFEDLRVDDPVSCLVEMDKNGIQSVYRVKIMEQ